MSPASSLSDGWLSTYSQMKFGARMRGGIISSLITPWDVLQTLQLGAHFVALTALYNPIRFPCRDAARLAKNKCLNPLEMPPTPSLITLRHVKETATQQP
jgi:hypothetical protein